MDQQAPALPPLLQDQLDDEPIHVLSARPESRFAYVERERQVGFPSLTPIYRQAALDFVLSGLTFKAIAQALECPLRTVQNMFGDPLMRAFIADLQKEYAIHRLLDAQWVEAQILKNLPKFEGEEAIPVVTKDGEQVNRKRFHGKELIAIYKHFGGNADQKKMGGVHVTIDFGSMGVHMEGADKDVVVTPIIDA